MRRKPLALRMQEIHAARAAKKQGPKAAAEPKRVSRKAEPVEDARELEYEEKKTRKKRSYTRRSKKDDF